MPMVILRSCRCMISGNRMIAKISALLLVGHPLVGDLSLPTRQEEHNHSLLPTLPAGAFLPTSQWKQLTTPRIQAQKWPASPFAPLPSLRALLCFPLLFCLLRRLVWLFTDDNVCKRQSTGLKQSAQCTTEMIESVDPFPPMAASQSKRLRFWPKHWAKVSRSGGTRCDFAEFSILGGIWVVPVNSECLRKPDQQHRAASGCCRWLRFSAAGPRPPHAVPVGVSRLPHGDGGRVQAFQPRPPHCPCLVECLQVRGNFEGPAPATSCTWPCQTQEGKRSHTRCLAGGRAGGLACGGSGRVWLGVMEPPWLSALPSFALPDPAGTFIRHAESI